MLALIVARAATLQSYDIWFDELYSLYAASGDPAGVWSAALADRVHPPGFYYLLWGWLQLVPPTPLGLRILPFLIWLAILGGSWWATERAGLDLPSRAVVLALVAANPLLFDLGGFVRNYGLAVASTTVAVGAALGILRRDGQRRQHDMWVLVIAAMLAAWSHVFAWPVLGAIVLALMLERHWRAALFTVIASALAILPWLVALLRSSGLERDFTENVGWQQAPTLSSLLLMPGRIFADRPYWAATVLATLAWLVLLLGLRSPQRRPLALMVITPLALALVASLVFRVGVWEVRYLTVTAVPLTLLLVSATASLPASARMVMPAAVLVLMLTGTLQRAEWRIPWRSITTRLAADGARTVYGFEGFTVLPVRYYSAMESHQLAVPEIKAWPPQDAPPGWLLLRPAMLPDSLSARDALRAFGHEVTDSFVVGTGLNAVAGWRFR